MRDAAKRFAELQEERDKTVSVQEHVIDDYKMKVKSMESYYEMIIKEALDTTMQRLDASSSNWKASSSALRIKNKSLLLDFGVDLRQLDL